MSVLLGGGRRPVAGSRAVRPAGTFLGWTVVWGGRRARRPRTPPEATKAECISGPKTGQTSARAQISAATGGPPEGRLNGHLARNRRRPGARATNENPQSGVRIG